ncbi:MAG: hypothetical protein ACTSX8_01615 [Alphaproteobacteria bacterium]
MNEIANRQWLGKARGALSHLHGITDQDAAELAAIIEDAREKPVVEVAKDAAPDGEVPASTKGRRRKAD